MESIKTNITDMFEMFNKRMTDFESQLNNPSAAVSSDTSSRLASEFSAFRTFIMGALGALQQQVQLLSYSVDDMEMRGRRKMLLLHGVPESNKEDTAQVVTKVVHDHLKLVTFSSNDIKRCHRLGRPTVHKPRPIVIKLHSLSLRDALWFDKIKLKGTGITVSEFLTKTRHNLFTIVREKFGVSNCWTKAGSIYVLGMNGTKHRISSKGDIDDITQNQQSQQLDPRRNIASKAKPSAETAPSKLKRAAAKK